EGIWARVLTPYAGNNYGIQFLPETGDEVLLGFLNADPNQAIVLGSMFSSGKPAPVSFSDDNYKKNLTGVSGIKIEFDDEKKSITIGSPAGKSMEINEDSGSVTIQDEHNNKIEMTSNGITISSDKDITFNASGDITIGGANVSVKADSSLTAKGTGSAEISSSGNTVVKGSLVQIN
ncbi:MAG: phage baseplate assembly protein V, partial [Bacteroidota bacterium]